MAKGRYGDLEKRRSPRHPKKFIAKKEYEGKVHEIRTIDISEHGVLLPKRLPPSVGTHVKVFLTMRGEETSFTGIVKRHTKCLFNGVETVGVGIEDILTRISTVCTA